MDTAHRRSPSNTSHAHSMASSQRHILGNTSDTSISLAANPSKDPYLTLAPYSGGNLGDIPTSATSLSVNFLPSKFSRPLSPGGGGIYKRKNAKGVTHKQGGGREAFKSGEARMPGENDDDYDGVDVTNVRQTWYGGPGARRRPKLRWNKFKWILFIMNLLVTIYSMVSFIFCLLTWFNVWTNADIIRVGNRTELVVSTLAACTGIVTSLVGWAGVLLNNRSFLAVYNLLLWATFAMIAAPGYLTYKRRTFNLEGKINAQWSQTLGLEGRLRVQNQLGCCGYFSPFVEATVSQTCYARSLLPGCKNGYLKFERKVLGRWYAVAFSIVPVHLAAIFAALLCSNHVTYRFGKGMMPKAYRLSMNSMAVIIDNYANQLAEQYGTDVASDLMGKSRSNLNLDNLSPLPYSPGAGAGGGSGPSTPGTPPGYSAGSVGRSGGGGYHASYQSVGGTIQDEYGKKF